MTLPIPTEEIEQTRFVAWLEHRGHKHTAIPNSTYTTSWKQKAKNTRTGLHAGFPDLLIIVGDQVICVEMKRQKGGTTSPAQQEWIEALNNAGIQTQVCAGFEKAVAFVESVEAAQVLRRWPHMEKVA